MSRAASSTLFIRLVVAVATLLIGSALLVAWEPQAVSDDPLVRMPGTQPADGVSLEAPNRCLNCHAGYNPTSSRDSTGRAR